ncbi:hypothetical protein SOM11_11570 [Frigoribacterium sp. CFBP9039]|uniref:hypothetical protein n=1 Tax=Frigoribacterium sp. CFBP9029 TaxID=3096541 RepID=UPI002A6AA0DB|nr:hypothetical protein [Frigoribacterium sp. CFBP9039]MDY0946624.1 hypothetical protein [Frigoribacterium sp. CFBP9039]
MSTIRSGLTALSLAALAAGTLSPTAALAAPSSTPGAGSSAVSNPAADASTSATSTVAPQVRRIEAYGTDHFTLNGSAPGAQMINIAIPGGLGDVPIVRQGRFTSILPNESLGKTAVITALGSDGRWSAPVEVVLEPFLADGEADAPGTPVVHAVSRYDGDDHIVVEGTVTSDPLMFERPVVVAPSLGLVYDAADANGAFALRVPAAHAGETLEIRATRSGLESDAVAVELVETESNTASEVHPLEVASPTAGDVLATPEATFAGSGIPNSQIVVTRDEKTNRASSTLCETRVSSLGDWSCTSPALPAGSHDTVITETPTWASAAKQETRTAFSIVDDADDDAAAGWTPSQPMLSSVTENASGKIVVRVIANRATTAEIVVGDHEETVRGGNGRFTFVLDGSLAGATATVTGILGENRGRSLEIPLTPVAAPEPSPLAAPRIHGIVGDAENGFYLAGTTSYFATEFDVPGVIVQHEGRFIGGADTTWNGAFMISVDAEYAGEELDVITVRDLAMSDRTTVVVEPTEGFDASEIFPIDVTSPAEGETIPADTEVFTGTGIPGSTVAISSTTEGSATLVVELGKADVFADGSWSVELDAPLSAGDHEMTVTETPYWTDAGLAVSTRSFTVADGSEGGEDGEVAEKPITVTTPTDGSTFAAGSIVTFAGTATPGADIAVRLGYGLAPVTGTANASGDWTVSRWLGNAPYTATITQSKDGQQIGERHTGPTITPAATTAPIVVTAPADGSTFAAGSVVTYTGTATPEATVSVRLGYGLAPLVAEADENGNWTVSRWLGNAPYTATITQSKDGKQIGGAHTGPTITPAATTAPVVVTAPTDRSTFAAGSVVTFTGTATPGADIAVHLGYGLAPVTGTANASGDWSVSRWLGNAPYTAKVIQSKNGTPLTATHTGPTITPAR